MFPAYSVEAQAPWVPVMP